MLISLCICMNTQMTYYISQNVTLQNRTHSQAPFQCLSTGEPMLWIKVKSLFDFVELQHCFNIFSTWVNDFQCWLTSNVFSVLKPQIIATTLQHWRPVMCRLGQCGMQNAMQRTSVQCNKLIVKTHHPWYLRFTKNFFFLQ